MKSPSLVFGSFRVLAGTLSRRLSPAACFTALVAALLTAGPARATPVVIEWVTVDDAGNTADYTGYGAVGYDYRIGKHEWTYSLYAQFLNSVDPQGLNPNGIWDPVMSNSIRGGLNFINGNTAGSKYTVKTNFGNKPVIYVSWFDAARVANWLHAGGQSYETTVAGSAAINDGAYTLNGATAGDTVAKNEGAQYWIPTLNEWYKAAYYKGGSNAGYWKYATQSDADLTPVTANAVGDGSAGPVGNFANFGNAAVWNGYVNITTVGTNGGPSAYGTFDQTGNLWEWNDLTGAPGPNRGLWGADFASANSVDVASNVGFTMPASSWADQFGFRLASAVAVPEPSTYAMALAGLAGGGYAIWRRRRRA